MPRITVNEPACPVDQFRHQFMDAVALHERRDAADQDTDETFDEMLAIGDAASITRATSIKGAAFQIALAGCELGVLLASETPQEHDLKTRLRRAERLVELAFAAMEDMHGLERRDFGESWLLREREPL